MAIMVMASGVTWRYGARGEDDPDDRPDMDSPFAASGEGAAHGGEGRAPVWRQRQAEMKSFQRWIM
jgi:hypothetical protein